MWVGSSPRRGPSAGGPCLFASLDRGAAVTERDEGAGPAPWAGVLGVALGHLSVDARAGVWPVYKALAGLDLPTAGGIATACTPAGNGLQLAFGPMADRGHRRWLLALGVIASGAVCFLPYATTPALLPSLMLVASAGSAPSTLRARATRVRPGPGAGAPPGRRPPGLRLLPARLRRRLPRPGRTAGAALRRAARRPPRHPGPLRLHRCGRAVPHPRALRPPVLGAGDGRGPRPGHAGRRGDAPPRGHRTRPGRRPPGALHRQPPRRASLGLMGLPWLAADPARGGSPARALAWVGLCSPAEAAVALLLPRGGRAAEPSRPSPTTA